MIVRLYHLFTVLYFPDSSGVVANPHCGLRTRIDSISEVENERRLDCIWMVVRLVWHRWDRG